MLSPFLTLDFSQPSTTLWEEEDGGIFGDRGTLLLLPPVVFLDGIPLMPVLDGLPAAMTSVLLESTWLLVGIQCSSVLLPCLCNSRFKLLFGSTDEVGLFFLCRVDWFTLGICTDCDELVVLDLTDF